ncbi:UNVERIFIED_CONTAM: hypothetical protein K2H54_066598 [Gekko kuhli]
MGLLVDLTNTTRFYDRNDIEKDGIKYIKLQCKGHGECPTAENTEMFIRICEHFSNKNPTELIEEKRKLENGVDGATEIILDVISRVTQSMLLIMLKVQIVTRSKGLDLFGAILSRYPESPGTTPRQDSCGHEGHRGGTLALHMFFRCQVRQPLHPGEWSGPF